MEMLNQMEQVAQMLAKFRRINIRLRSETKENSKEINFHPHSYEENNGFGPMNIFYLFEISWSKIIHKYRS